MLESIWDLIRELLGLGKDQLNASEMAVRAVITFAVTVAIVRFGDKRMFGKGTAFDTVVAIMIGSIMSRAITGQSPLFPTWVAGAVLIGMHWLLAVSSFHLDWFGPMVKGNPIQLIKDGQVQEGGVREGSVTQHDLEQALRIQGNEPDPSQIKVGYLERDGSISLVPKKQEPRVLHVSVADGVQTVRIELD